MSSGCRNTTAVFIWTHTDHSELMQLCLVRLNIHQRSVLVCRAKPKPRAAQNPTLFCHLGFGNASPFMLWPSACRSILTAEARRWQHSSSGLTQLGSGNSSFPTPASGKGITQVNVCSGTYSSKEKERKYACLWQLIIFKLFSFKPKCTSCRQKNPFHAISLFES